MSIVLTNSFCAFNRMSQDSISNASTNKPADYLHNTVMTPRGALDSSPKGEGIAATSDVKEVVKPQPINLSKLARLTTEGTLESQLFSPTAQQLAAIDAKINQMWNSITSTLGRPAADMLKPDAQPFIPSGPTMNLLAMREPRGRSFANPSQAYVPLPRKAEGDLVDSNFQHPRRPRKVKLCRHFLGGHCHSGRSCNFLHDCSVFLPDNQKVFMGGIPAGTTAPILIEEMRKAGYVVVNEPMIHSRGFAPKVCVESPAVADRLVRQRQVLILGKTVDIRRYNDRSGHNVAARTVCLTALPVGATEYDIRSALEPLGFGITKVAIRGGNAEQVTLKTVDMADALLILGRLTINEKCVAIVPYMGRSVGGSAPTPPPRCNRTMASPRFEGRW